MEISCPGRASVDIKEYIKILLVQAHRHILLGKKIYIERQYNIVFHIKDHGPWSHSFYVLSLALPFTVGDLKRQLNFYLAFWHQ